MVQISIESRHRAGAGTVFNVFGGFLLFTAAITGYMAYLEGSKWQRLHDEGTKVVGVVSEKHVIESGPDLDGDTSTYRRAFFLPTESVQGSVADLWRQTSVATRYPDSVELFADWGNRLWADYGASDFEELAVGESVEILIDGKDSMVFVSGGPPRQAWVICGVAGLLGLSLIVLGKLKRRRASMPAAGETVWDTHGDGSS